MDRVMQVADCFKRPNTGIIISGHNRDLDGLNTNEIKKYIGTKILIKNPDNTEIIVEGVVVDVGTSLLGRKNIHICLPGSIELLDIKTEATVFTLSDELSA